MANAYVLHGDIEAALVAELLDAPEIDDFPGGAPRVSTDMRGYTMGDRWIMVSLEGGTRRWPIISRPRVDVHVLAKTRTVAQNLAQVAEAVLFAAQANHYPTYGLVLTDVKEETGMFRAPDNLTGSERYIFSLRLTMVPTH